MTYLIYTSHLRYKGGTEIAIAEYDEIKDEIHTDTEMLLSFEEHQLVANYELINDYVLTEQPLQEEVINVGKVIIQ